MRSKWEYWNWWMKYMIIYEFWVELPLWFFWDAYNFWNQILSYEFAKWMCLLAKLQRCTWCTESNHNVRNFDCSHFGSQLWWKALKQGFRKRTPQVHCLFVSQSNVKSLTSRVPSYYESIKDGPVKTNVFFVYYWTQSEILSFYT